MSDPNAIRTTHLTRDAAWELLTRYNKDAFHLHHAETVEKTMRYLARELGYAEEEDYWGIVGMLHDIDFEQWPQQHCVKSQALLKELGVKGARFKVAEYRTERHDAPNVQTASAKLSGLHTLGVRQLSRDVIGVNKVGYVLI